MLYYRIYTALPTEPYKLQEITPSKEKALSYSDNEEYVKVLIIEHNLEKNMDTPISLTFPHCKKLTKRRNI